MVSKELAEIFADINDAEEMELFFKEIFTPGEVEDISLRWQLLKALHQGETQRSIAARHGISLCKITRGSKILKNKDSITIKLLEKYFKGEK